MGAILILMFIFVLFTIGCNGFSTPLLSVPETRSTMILTKPPMQLYISGSHNDINVTEVSQIIRELDKATYYPYKFNDSFSAEHGIGLKSSQSYKWESNTRIEK